MPPVAAAFLASCAPTRILRRPRQLRAHRVALRAPRHVRVQPRAVLLPLRTEAVGRVVPVVGSVAQAAHVFGSPWAALDRVLAAAAVLAVLLLVFPALGAASALALAAAIPFLGPLFAASRRNAALRAHPHAALLLGTLRARPTRTSKGVPALRVVISAEDATAQAVVPASPALQALMTEGRPVLARALVFAHDPTFRSIDRVADVYVPALDAFLAKYPYVRRRPFFELSNHADDLMRVSPDLFVVD